MTTENPKNSTCRHCQLAIRYAVLGSNALWVHSETGRWRCEDWPETRHQADPPLDFYS